MTLKEKPLHELNYICSRSPLGEIKPPLLYNMALRAATNIMAPTPPTTAKVLAPAPLPAVVETGGGAPVAVLVRFPEPEAVPVTVPAPPVTVLLEAAVVVVVAKVVEVVEAKVALDEAVPSETEEA